VDRQKLQAHDAEAAATDITEMIAPAVLDGRTAQLGAGARRQGAGHDRRGARRGHRTGWI
jgi:hypothetical protein